MRLPLLIASCATLLAACNPSKEAPPATPSGDGPVTSWPATRKTADGGFNVTLKPTAGEIVENQHFSLEVSIEPTTAGDGALKVTVDADMPAHKHGMNTQPELVPLGERNYRADGMLFHMAGEWVVMVDVTRNGRKERASFPVQVD